MKKRFSVCFIGIDGSGKTTHAFSLYQNLGQLGIVANLVRPEYLVMRYMPNFFLTWMSKNVFSRSKARIDGSEKSSKDGRYLSSIFSKARHSVLNSGLLLYSWLTYLALVELRNKVIIFDRYFYDWVFNLNQNRMNGLLFFLPKPDMVFVLDLEVNDAFSRMHSEKDKEFRREYYSSLRNWYLEMARLHGFIVVSSKLDFAKMSSQELRNTLSYLRG
jgi:thymidylate kinase